MTPELLRAIASGSYWISDSHEIGAFDVNGTTTASAMAAEIDRLRTLPVIATCGECGHASPRSRQSHLCDHPDVYDVPDPMLLTIDHDTAPPARCPLRGAR